MTQNNKLEMFIQRNRKICWEAEYQNGEYCIGENALSKFVHELFKEGEPLKSKEEVLSKFFSCTCRDTYTSRGMEDTYCVLHGSGFTIMQAMEEWGDIRVAAAQFKEPSLPALEPGFIKFVKKERRDFSRAEHELWLSRSPKERVAIENLLIAYDQMVERLEQHPVQQPVAVMHYVKATDKLPAIKESHRFFPVLFNRHHDVAIFYNTTKEFWLHIADKWIKESEFDLIEWLDESPLNGEK
jgi:hypothetical protein